MSKPSIVISDMIALFRQCKGHARQHMTKIIIILICIADPGVQSTIVGCYSCTESLSPYSAVAL